MFRVQLGLHKIVEVGEGESEVEQSKCNDYVISKMLSRHYEAIPQQSRSPETNDFHTLFSMFRVQVGPHMLFEGKEEESEMEQSECTDCVRFKLVD